MKKNNCYLPLFKHKGLQKLLLIMRLSFVINLIFAVTISANSFSQDDSFTLNLNDVSVKDVIKKIEAQSEFRFFYNDELSDISKRVTISFKDTKIDVLLTKLFENTGITFKILENNLIVIAPETSIQQKQISGTITDAKTGELLPGVNIMVEGTTLGVTSDINGKYSIEVSDGNAVLIFSYVGYLTQKVTVSDKSTVDISLQPDIKELDEVVVIGYGTVKKSDLTGSVGSVSSETLTAKGTTSLMSAIQGTVAGVNITNTSARPGGGYSIQIRGQNSLKEGNPLYVVDGVVTSDIDFLNPADIEHIDVLKDASSTAIYGSRGSNGVVIVQTKNASNVKTAKMNVSYDGYYGVRSIARMPEFMNGREWIDFRTSAYYSWNATTKIYELTTANKTGVLNGSTVVNQRLYEQDYEDWIKLATRDGQQQNHYLNLSGNIKDISYNVGLGYQNEEGNFIQESFDRYNVKVSINHKPSKYFQSGAIINLSQTNYDAGSQYGYRDIMKMPDILHAYDDAGNIVPQPGIKDVIKGSGNFTSSSNPLLEIQGGSQETRRQDIIASLFAQLSPFEGLDIKSTISPRFNRTRIGKYYGAVAGNRNENYASTDNSESMEYTWDNQLSYNKTFNNHHIGATFINSIYHTRYENITAAAQNLPYKSDWYNIYSGTLVPGDCKSSYSETAMLSYAGRVNYDYKGKYLATATLRYDGSSKLAEKWEAFPSFALAWRASEEDFLENNWLSNLKLRFSFGYSGNNNVDAYSTKTNVLANSRAYYYDFGSTASGFAPGLPVTEDLTWEKTREINGGIDYGFFKGRISGTIDVYNKLSDGLLMARSLTIESGVTSMTDNIGSVSNKGIELTLNTINFSSKNFFWSTNFTFAHNKNAIVSLYGKKEDVIGEKRFIDEPINVIYDYKILGVWTQAEYDAGLTTIGTYTAKPGEAKTLDASGNGTLGAEDKVILGSPDPTWTGSFTSNLQFKNWDFSFNIYTKQGVYLFDRFTEQYGYNTQRGMAKVKFDYYMPANVPSIDWNNFAVDGSGNATAQWGNTGTGHENAKYPLYKNANGAYYGDNGNYQDASFIKVKNITLGYTFGNKIVSKIHISSLRLYVNVLNPFTITDYVGWDPEYAATQLVDGNGPSSIVYQFGINVKF